MVMFNDNVLIDALVKDQDIIIHLASALPPLSNMKKGLAEIIDYNGYRKYYKSNKLL